VLRWFIDPGGADEQRAFRVLAQRLAALSDVPVERLVVGTEWA
jgi:hypothetical protein